MESTPATRVCRLCGLNKPLDEYYYRRDKRIATGLVPLARTECKQCAIDKERYKRTGVCRVKLEEMLVKQKGLCAICGCVLNSSRYTRLAVDHCHKTMKFRGLLCGNCNTSLGLMKDSPLRLQSAIEYLNRHNPV